MKHINILFVVLGIMMLVLVGCTDNSSITGPEKNAAQSLPVGETVATIKLADAPKAVAFPIMIDKTTSVGTISVQNTKDFIYITYLAEKDWAFKETNVHVASTIQGIPQSRDGLPSPQQFAHINRFQSEVKAYTTQIPLSDYNFQIGQQVILAINFALFNPENPEVRQQLITGWGGTKNGPGPEWWNVIPYTLMEEKNQGSGDKIDNIIVLDKNDDLIIQ